MNKKIIAVGISLFVVFLVVVMILARPSQITSQIHTNQSSDVDVNTDPASFFDFGTISMARGTVERVFTLKNTHAEAVTLKSIYTSCMCTSAVLEYSGKSYGPFGMPGHGMMPSVNVTLAPNEEATLKVVFDPAAHGPAGVGPIERTVVVEDGSTEPFAVMTIRALVTP